MDGSATWEWSPAGTGKGEAEKDRTVREVNAWCSGAAVEVDVPGPWDDKSVRKAVAGRIMRRAGVKGLADGWETTVSSTGGFSVTCGSDDEAEALWVRVSAATMLGQIEGW